MIISRLFSLPGYSGGNISVVEIVPSMGIIVSTTSVIKRRETTREANFSFQRDSDTFFFFFF